MEGDASLNKDSGFYPVGHGKIGSNIDPRAHLRKIITAVVQIIDWRESGMISSGKVGTLTAIRVINDEDLSQNGHNENGKEGDGMKDIWEI